MISFNRFMAVVVLMATTAAVAQNGVCEEMLRDEITRVCPVVCTGPTGAAQFCNVTVSQLLSASGICITNNARVGGTLELCNMAYTYAYTDPAATLATYAGAGAQSISFATVGANKNITPSAGPATTFTASIAGTYTVRYVVEPTAALTSNITFDLLHNGTTVAGSTFVAATATYATADNFAIVGQALITLAAGDTIALQGTSVGAQTLTGTASISIYNIAPTL